MKNLFYLSLVLPLLFSCGDASGDAGEEIFKIGSTYAFFTYGCEFDCDECSSSWKIKFIDKSNAELWSHTSSSDFPSCKSDVKYKYENEIISITRISNSNVSSSCKSSITGDYKYDSEKRLFISTKDSDCNLNWYK